jgi:hypothetical protein
MYGLMWMPLHQALGDSCSANIFYSLRETIEMLVMKMTGMIVMMLLSCSCKNITQDLCL